MPDINHLLETHQYLPYLILLVWTFLEGETIVIIAGIAAREGHPWLPLVIACSFSGSLCSDQLMFFLGRFKGKVFVAKRPAWQVRAEKVYRLLEKHQTWLILGFRFLYGLRNITPFAIGMSQVSTKRFLILNIIGAAVWATVFACGGYLFGAAMETVFAKHQKPVVLSVLLVVVIVFWIVRIVRRRAAQKKLTLPPADPS
jgi:membrane protein DedA with SNARE-associated domain